MLEVAAGILTHAGDVLACRRRFDAMHPGKWEFPGGKREPGETLTQCLRRELSEELGITAEIGVELWRTAHTYTARPPIQLFFFHVPHYTGHLANRAFAEIRWVPPGGLAALDFLAADRGLVTLLDTGKLQLLPHENRSPSSRAGAPRRRP